MEKRGIKSTRTEKTIFSIVMILMIGSFVYALLRAIYVPLEAEHNGELLSRNDYLLMTVSSLAAILVLLLPSLIEKKWKFDIPSTMHVVFILFIFAGVFLGEFRRFHFSVSNFDKWLHIISGGALAAISFSLISLLDERDIVKMNPLFIALFSFSFALMIGVLWEVYEFAWDFHFDFNMQKYATDSGELLMGKEALYDTMMDFVADAIGAFSVSLLGYLAVKNNWLWFDHLLIKKIVE
jgi:hypothetical protein